MNRKLSVEFVKLPEKNQGACMYQVVVDGVSIGTLCKDYEPGFVTARMCVGGSAPGFWAWYLELEESLEDARTYKFWFIPMENLWRRQKDARSAIERAMDFSLPVPTCEWAQASIDVFTTWLKEQKEAS